MDDPDDVLFWDFFSVEKTAKIVETGPLPDDAETAEIRRTDGQKLELTAWGPLGLELLTHESDEDAGNVMESPPPIRLQTKTGDELCVDGFFLNGAQPGPEQGSVSGSIQQVDGRYSDEVPDFRIDWLVNGPRFQRFHWPNQEAVVENRTERFFSPSVSDHADRPEMQIDNYETGLGSDQPDIGSTWNHVVVEPPIEGVEQIRIGQSRSERPPEEWNPMFVLYELGKESVGEVPHRNVHAAVSFLLGSELGWIGSTFLDGRSRTTRAIGKSLNLIGGKSRIEKTALPPAPLAEDDPPPRRRIDQRLFDDAFNSLVRRFEQDDFWRHVLNYLWYGRHGSLAVQALQFSAGLEAVSDVAAESEAGTILPREKFAPVKERLLEAFQEKVERVEGPEEPSDAIGRLEDRLRNLNRASWEARVIEPLKDLGLDIGKVETDSLKHRHAAAHGDLDVDQPPPVGHWRTRALQTLFHRAFLAATGTADHYWDYSTEGWPRRPLENRLGGPNDDGQPVVE